MTPQLQAAPVLAMLMLAERRSAGAPVEALRQQEPRTGTGGAAARDLRAGHNLALILGRGAVEPRPVLTPARWRPWPVLARWVPDDDR